MRLSRLFRFQRPEPELPIVAQEGDVIVFENKFYRVEKDKIVELPIVKAPQIR